ncbi:MAG: SPASM domain-containing protein, partial [Desulfobacterales bacterium]|nr:SPASM domain-containing protein [Desulfobacterales bacterium]
MIFLNAPFPRLIHIETSAYCNLKCRGCFFHGPHHWTTRPKGFISLELWKHLIQEIASWKQPVTISAHGGGEPLLHPHFLELIEFAVQYPTINIGFLTNAMYLTPDLSKQLLNMRIAWIGFSLDGIHHKTHHQLRLGSDFNLITTNIRQFIQLRNDWILKNRTHSPKIFINMVLYPEIISQTSVFLKQWVPHVDRVNLSFFRESPHARKLPSVLFNKRIPCFMLWKQMAITWDGQVILCCEDYNAEEIIGKAGSSTLHNIWLGDRMNRIRHYHRSNKPDLIPVCKQCDVWADVYAKIRLNHQHGWIIHHHASHVAYRKSRYNPKLEYV